MLFDPFALPAQVPDLAPSVTHSARPLGGRER